MAEGSFGRAVHAKVPMTRPIPATRPRIFPSLLRLTITAFLHRVNGRDSKLNTAFYTIHSNGFKD
jgi:hypothetical protein